MIRPRLVLCSGAELAAGDDPKEGWHVVRLDTLNRGSNTHLRLENVTKAFLRQMSPRIVDLLEIATYVYAADCEASRELAWVDDYSTETWERDFHFVIPVRDVEFWQDMQARDSLESALRFLSSDRFRFIFRPFERKDRSAQQYLQIEDIEDTPFYEADRVVMLSGGLDSLAGALEVAVQGRPLVAVSHRPVAQTHKIQRELMQLLRGRYATPMMHVPVWVNKSGFSNEASQRTRTFLFSALGVAAASILRAGGVRFYENGVTSLNWPLASQVLRSRASRTTHPETLLRLQCLYRLVTEQSSFVVDNPFVLSTKADVVAYVAGQDARDLIAHTCSCTHTMFRGKTQWHCGVCGQCLDRRIAVLASGQEEDDGWGDYEADVFTGPRKDGYEHDIAVNYARFAADLERMTEGEIAEAYSLELTRTARCFERQGDIAQEFLAMHKRHAADVCQVLRDQVARHSHQIVTQPLDSSSLLSMLVRQEHLGASAQRTERLEDSEQPVFRKGVGVWEVSYKGSHGPVQDARGMRIAAFLLARPRVHVSSLLLARVAKGGVHIPARDADALAQEENLMGDPFGGRYELLTQEDIQDLRRRIREEDALAKTAGLVGEHGEANSLQRNAAAMRETLRRDTDIRGRARPFIGAAEQARKSVAKNIGAVITRLGERHPRLAAHLDRTIQTGTRCVYMPEEEVTWRTE